MNWSSNNGGLETVSRTATDPEENAIVAVASWMNGRLREALFLSSTEHVSFYPGKVLPQELGCRGNPPHKIEIPTDRKLGPEEYHPPRPRPDTDAIRDRTPEARLREDAEGWRRDGRHERGASRHRGGSGVGRGDGPGAGARGHPGRRRGRAPGRSRPHPGDRGFPHGAGEGQETDRAPGGGAGPPEERWRHDRRARNP